MRLFHYVVILLESVANIYKIYETTKEFLKNPSLREENHQIHPSLRDVFHEIPPSMRDFSYRNNAMRIICCNFAPENEEI